MNLDLHEQEIRIRVGGIILQDGKMLLIAHQKDGGIYWLLPGGGVAFGENLKDALKREFLEELNVDVNVDDIAFLSDSIAPSGERHIINICFQCAHVSGEYVTGKDARLHGFGFFDADEIALLKIYPPINSELISILQGRQFAGYLGNFWVNK
ncbi:MAG: NUDIX domain-containing protein [Leptospirales bacterium]|nr:NUDIX domain-containing protein [Leptospirales bacterium]